MTIVPFVTYTRQCLLWYGKLAYSKEKQECYYPPLLYSVKFICNWHFAYMFKEVKSMMGLDLIKVASITCDNKTVSHLLNSIMVFTISRQYITSSMIRSLTLKSGIAAPKNYSFLKQVQWQIGHMAWHVIRKTTKIAVRFLKTITSRLPETLALWILVTTSLTTTIREGWKAALQMPSAVHMDWS